jgi:shikimate kinase
MSSFPDKIFLIGFMGVGKSHWGQRLASALQYAEADCLRSIASAPGNIVLACGGGTPCFLNNLDSMKAAGRVIWLQAEAKDLLPRLLAEKQTRPLLRDISDIEMERYVMKKMGDRQLFYQEAHRSVPEKTLTEANLIKTLLNE